MKRIIILLCAVLFFSCGAKKEDAPTVKVTQLKSGVVEIKEKMFLAQTNDVYLNPDEYLGKTLKLEGLMKRDNYGDSSYYFVVRYGPGCCGYDGNAGFQISWDDSAIENYPEEDAWVEAEGVLKEYIEDDYPYLYIALSKLEEKEARGAEFVSQ